MPNRKIFLSDPRVCLTPCHRAHFFLKAPDYSLGLIVALDAGIRFFPPFLSKRFAIDEQKGFARCMSFGSFVYYAIPNPYK